MIEDNKLKLSINLALIIFGVISIYQIVPYFTQQLLLLVELFKLTDTSPEFMIMLICLSIYVTSTVMNLIVNIIYKLYKIVNDKWLSETSNKKREK